MMNLAETGLKEKKKGKASCSEPREKEGGALTRAACIWGEKKKGGSDALGRKRKEEIIKFVFVKTDRGVTGWEGEGGLSSWQKKKRRGKDVNPEEERGGVPLIRVNRGGGKHQRGSSP